VRAGAQSALARLLTPPTRRISKFEITGCGNDEAAFDFDSVASAAADLTDGAGAKSGEMHARAGREGHPSVIVARPAR
jgi:hypothetical protein